MVSSTDDSRWGGMWERNGMGATVHLCGVLVVLVGGAVLVGWAFSIPLLQTLLPGFVSMKPNTASCFVGTGSALLLLAREPVPRGRLWIAYGCALAVIALSGLLLLQFALNWDSGLDEILFKDTADTPRTASPGRMALPTTLAFMLSGLALLVLNWEVKRAARPADWLAVAIFLFGAASLLQQTLTTATFDQILGVTPMALHTALAFMALSVGILFARPNRGLLWFLRADVSGPLERRIYVTLAIGALFLTLNGTAALLSAQDSLARAASVDTVHGLRRQLVSILSSVQDLQTGERGFVLTGDEAYLTPYQRALGRLSTEFVELRPLVEGEPAQTAGLGELEDLVKAKVDRVEEIVALRRLEGFESAAAAVRGGTGKEVMDEIRSLVSSMDDVARDELAVREVEEQESFSRLLLTSALGGVLTFGVMLLAAVGIRRGFMEARDADARLGLVADNIDPLAWMADQSGEIFWYSRRWFDYTGTTMAEMRVEGLRGALHPAHVERVEGKMRRCFANGEIWEDTFPLRGADGNYRWFLSRAVPFVDSNGSLFRWFGTHTDVTGQRETEEALRASEQTLATTLRSIGDAVMTVNMAGNVIGLNPVAEELTGWTEAEARGRPVAEVFRIVNEETRAAAEMPVDKVIQSGRIQGLANHTMLIRRDGAETPIADSAAPLRGEDGEMLGVVLVFRDVGEERAAEAELKRAKLEAESANAAKSAFLATMSHEIRTPMNGVIGTVDVLRLSSLRPYQAELVETIRESAFSLLTVIDDVLDFSKLEADKLDIDREAVSLPRIVEGVCSMLHPIASRKGVRLRTFIDPEAPDAIVTDPVRLRQILNNLAGNAVKFSAKATRDGLVKIRVTKDSRERLQVLVVDNGIGMAEDVMAKLFEPFTQADSTTTRRFGGTGLGLSITRRLVGLLGGEIDVASAVGQGSTFRVTLPLETPPETVLETARPDLSGVYCVVVTDDEELSHDWQCYVTACGSTAAGFRTLGEAAAHTLPRGGEAVVVAIPVKEAGSESYDGLRRAFSAYEGEVRYVVVTPGRRRRPRFEAADLVTLDDSVMRRDGFMQAVAAAAGRVELVDERDEGPEFAGDATPLSREDALALGRLVLVAEDNDINQKVIASQLGMLRYGVEIAVDGREALNKWRKGGFSVVLTDLHMPNMDGYELTEAIRREETDGRRTPIVALTADITRGERERCVNAGMDDYISKPVKLESLNAILAKFISAEAASGPEFAVIAESAGEVREEAVAFDRTVLSEMLGGDAAMAEQFLHDFVGSLNRTAEEIRTAYFERDWKGIASLAHRLKSSSRWVGALALGAVCEKMEALGMKDEGAGILALRRRFEIEVSNAISAIANKERG